MKKILFLLLLTVASYGQTYQNPTFGTVKTMTAPTVTTTPHLGTVETNGTISKITPANLPVSTATTNALELETDVSAGAVSDFALTNNGNGTVNIGDGIAYLRATNNPFAQIIKYPISAVTNLALTDNANNYVLVDYNGGSPTITVTTNASTINTQTNSLAYVIARVGNNLEYLNLVGQNVDPNAKLRIRFLNQEGIRRASGAVLGFSNRNLTLTSSVLFSGLIRINAAAFNTASPDTFTLAYNNGSVWTRTTGQTQINNTEYNVSGTLTTMPNNTFRTDYVYLLPNNPSKLYVIMGNTTYSSLTLAKGAPRPSSLPVELQVLGLEVGRLFIEKNSAAIAEVQSSFANDFIGAAVPEHNSLTGLQGGLSDQRNHLDNAQVALVNAPKTLQYSYDNGSQITTSPSNGAVAIRRGSAADTDNILVGQNGAGSTTFSFTGAGNLTSSSGAITYNNITGQNIFNPNRIQFSDNAYMAHQGATSGNIFKSTSTGWESGIAIRYASDLSGTYTSRSLVDKAYADLKELASNKATDFTTINNTLYPSVQAVNNKLKYEKPFYCTIRNTSGTWDIVSDSNHFYSDNITSVANATLTNAVINISTAAKIGSIIATTDETYARYGLFVGATVSPTTIGIDVYKKGFDGYISYDGSNWAYNPGQGVLISASDVTFSYDTTNGILTVTHTIASGDTSEYGINLTKRSSMTAIDAYLGTVTLTSFQVYFKDVATQSPITTPTTDMKFFFNRDMIWKVPNSILGLTNSNIWLSGTLQY